VRDLPCHRTTRSGECREKRVSGPLGARRGPQWNDRAAKPGRPEKTRVKPLGNRRRDQRERDEVAVLDSEPRPDEPERPDSLPVDEPDWPVEEPDEEP
jgi:hypothetical protein